MERAFRAVRRSEVAVLVLDASEGVTQQDFRLAEYIVSAAWKFCLLCCRLSPRQYNPRPGPLRALHQGPCRASQL